MPTVVVTGAAGFIGSHTCEELLAAGCTVVGVDNFRTGSRKNLSQAIAHPQFTLQRCDITDFRSFDRCVRAASPMAIIHLAALVSVPESIEDPALNYRLNVLATQNVADAARRRRVGRVVFASSAAVYGSSAKLPLRESATTFPMNPYGGAKLASEALLLAQGRVFGFDVICLRYFNVFGPRQDPLSPYSGVISIFTERMLRKLPITILGDGKTTRDFISVHDVARVNVHCALERRRRHTIANVCSGRRVSLDKLCCELRRLLPDAPAPVYASPRPGDIRHSVGSPARLKRDFGLSTTVEWKIGLRELVSNLRGHGD